MRLRFMSAKFVALQPTLGIVFQERGVIRLCFVWWHLVIDWSQPTKRALDALPQRGSWRNARGVLSEKTENGERQ